MDLSPWRILKLTPQVAAPDRGRSLISTIKNNNNNHDNVYGAIMGGATGGCGGTLHFWDPGYREVQ